MKVTIFLIALFAASPAALAEDRPHTVWVSPWDGKTRYQCTTRFGNRIMTENLADCATTGEMESLASKRRAEAPARQTTDSVLDARAMQRLLDARPEPVIAVAPAPALVKDEVQPIIERAVAAKAAAVPSISPESTESWGMVLRVFAVFAVLTYFAPSLIAFYRRKLNAGAILALNIFLGWTFLGWVIALVWSVAHERVPAQG